jgi:hypothetical protein
MSTDLLLKALALTLSLSLMVACATPASWDKPGATDAATTKDASDCHEAARKEAIRLYPPGFSGMIPGPSALASQHADSPDRGVAESRLF